MVSFSRKTHRFFKIYKQLGRQLTNPPNRQMAEELPRPRRLTNCSTMGLLCLLIVLLTTACGSTPEAAPTSTPLVLSEVELATDTPPAEPPEADTGDLVEAESNRDGVFTISVNGDRVALPAPGEIFLETGAGVDVDESGRAILRFADLLTVEVLRDGELTIQELSLEDQAAVVTILQNGGALLNDFNAPEEIERRFTIETEFATITSTGTRFLVASEAGSPLEWIVGLDATEDDLQITAAGVTKAVPAGTARWVAPIGEPSAGIEARMDNVDAWLEQIQNGVQVTEIGEVVWAPADMQADTGRLTAVPPIGETFDLGTEVQLTLAIPTSASGHYWLEDCNGDGFTDIAMQDGLLQMDFREVPARVRALDVTVLNRANTYAGALQLLDPAQADMVQVDLTAAQNEGELLSLRADIPFHYADLTLTDGCFLGFSLTPPDANGNPGEPRTLVSPENENVLGRPPANGSFVAWPVGPNAYNADMRIDNETADWQALDNLLAGQEGAGWFPIETIVYDDNCASVTNEFTTDLAGQVRFAYDADYLYVAFLAEDDYYKVYSDNDFRFYLGDSPQLLLDTDLNGDLTTAQNSQDDIQLDFHPGFRRAGATSARAALWRLHTSPPTANLVESALVTATPIQNEAGLGYFLEAAVPWSAIGVQPQSGLVLGLAASISDDDTAVGNDQECMISTAPERDWQDPTTWGTLMLAPR